MKKLLIVILCLIGINLLGSSILSSNIRCNVCIGDNYSFFITGDYKLIVYNNQLNVISKEIPFPSELVNWVSIPDQSGLMCLYPFLVKDKNNNIMEHKVLIVGTNRGPAAPYYDYEAYAWIYNISAEQWVKVNPIAVRMDPNSSNMIKSSRGNLFLKYNSAGKYGISIINYNSFI